MKNILLTRCDQGWNLTSDDKETMELFGTNTIPTAFTKRAPSSMVFSRIRKLNPESIIYILDNGKYLSDKHNPEILENLKTLAEQ